MMSTSMRNLSRVLLLYIEYSSEQWWILCSLKHVLSKTHEQRMITIALT